MLEGICCIAHSRTAHLGALQPLMEAGLDSIAAVELRNAITARFGVEVPATATFDYPSAGQLAGFVSSRNVAAAWGHAPAAGAAGAWAEPTMVSVAVPSPPASAGQILDELLPVMAGRHTPSLPTCNTKGQMNKMRNPGWRLLPCSATAQPQASRQGIIEGMAVGFSFPGVMGMDVPEDQPLMEAGLDSIGAVELRNAVSASFGIELPATVTFDYPTPHALAQYIAGQMAPAAGRLAAGAVTQTMQALPGTPALEGNILRVWGSARACMQSCASKRNHAMRHATVLYSMHAVAGSSAGSGMAPVMRSLTSWASCRSCKAWCPACLALTQPQTSR